MKMQRRGISGIRRRPTLRDLLRTYYIRFLWGTALASLVLIAGPFLLLAAITFDHSRRLARVTARAAFGMLLRHQCRLAAAPLQIDDACVDWAAIGPCIVVANHFSSLDAVMLMQLPRGVGDGRIWAKGWPFRTPFLGWMMRLSGHLRVDNFNLLPDAKDYLGGGETMLVFPESSRSRTGTLARFRDGAFLLATHTGRPIVPVAIHGTFACFPPDQGWIYRPVLRMEVLGVLRPCTGPRAHAELKQQAHTMIAAALESKGARMPLAAAS